MRTHLIVSLMAVTILIVFGAISGGFNGALSTSIGIAGTTFYLAATWWLVQLVGKASEGSVLKKTQLFLTGGAVILKLPLIYLGWKAVQNLGPFGPNGFLFGLGLVYCVVIWRAVLTAKD